MSNLNSLFTCMSRSDVMTFALYIYNRQPRKQTSPLIRLPTIASQLHNYVALYVIVNFKVKKAEYTSIYNSTKKKSLYLTKPCNNCGL